MSTLVEHRIAELEAAHGETKSDHETRLRAIEARLAWIAGGLALLVVEIPIAIKLLT